MLILAQRDRWPCDVHQKQELPGNATRVSVRTVARLHFGFTSLSNDMGRCYGSIGLALERPFTNIEVFGSNKFEVIGGNREKILWMVKEFSERYDIQPRLTIKVETGIPEHSGLGSGTQLALAVGVSLAKMHNIVADAGELAGVMGRGSRSGIGIAAFESGGFIIDAGHKHGARHGPDQRPTIVFRHDFPADWCFLVVIPSAKRGLNGMGENAAFASLSPSITVSEKICRLTHLKLIPALIEKDIAEFGSALTEIDQKTGSYFADAQGGVYGEDVTGEIVDFMLRAGAYGAGQSSWGPAIYGLVDGSCAGSTEAALKAFMERTGRKGAVFVAQARNRGAEIDVES